MFPATCKTLTRNKKQLLGHFGQRSLQLLMQHRLSASWWKCHPGHWDKQHMRWKSLNHLYSPTMMCKAEVTGSLVPTVAKQMQSVDPVGWEAHRSMVGYCSTDLLQTLWNEKWPFILTRKQTVILPSYSKSFTVLEFYCLWVFKVCKIWPWDSEKDTRQLDWTRIT